MKFNEVMILEWYDNVIKAFCKSESNTFYCTLLALNKDNDEKIYLCISLEYFTYKTEILQLINSDKLSIHWNDLFYLLNRLNDNHKSYLISTKDLKKNSYQIKEYKSNFKWPKNFLFSDYPLVLNRAKKIDDWWGYWKM